MQKDIKRNSMESRLKEELEWYTLYASDEEYDEKAVESILYLLDRWEPLEEGTVPPVEESWKRFLAIKDRKELLPVEDPDIVLNAARKKAAAVQEAEQGEAVAAARKIGQGEMAAVVQMADYRKEKGTVQTAGQVKEKGAEQADIAEARRILGMRTVEAERDSMAAYENCVTGGTGKETDGNADMENAEAEKAEPADIEKAVGSRGIRKVVKFASRHKIIAAVVLGLVILMVGNTVHVVANPEAGFFFWMKRDDSGVQMITSPEGLDGKVDRTENIFYNKEDAPEWAQDWLQIEEKIEMPENYEWLHFEANELDNRNEVAVYYWNNNIEGVMTIGVWIYQDEVLYGREKFIGYSYIQSYEVNQKQMDIYRREEGDGVFYIVSFYDGNSQYYIRGQEDLEELQVLIEEYWYCVNNF